MLKSMDTPVLEATLFQKVKTSMFAGEQVEPFRTVRRLAPNQGHIEWHLTVLNQVCVPSI